MNEKTLRDKLIKLAHTNPKLRKDLLPILKGMPKMASTRTYDALNQSYNRGYGKPTEPWKFESNLDEIRDKLKLLEQMVKRGMLDEKKVFHILKSLGMELEGMCENLGGLISAQE